MTDEAELRQVFALDADALRCPYPRFAVARDHPGLMFVEEIDAWLVTRYEDIVHVARHPDLFCSVMPTGPVLARQQVEMVGAILAEEPELMAMLAGQRGGTRVLLNADPPEHMRQRRLVNRAFTPPKVAALEPRMRAIAHGLLDELPDLECVDIVREYGVLLPLTIIAEALGVPQADLPQFKEWSDAFVAAIGNHHLTREQLKAILVSQNEFFAYFADVIRARRAEPRDDLISDIVHATIEGEPLPDHEMLGMFNQFLVAGNETTTKLIGAAVRVLVERPDLQHELRRQPDGIPAFVEEVLRLEPPVQGLFRTATVDTTVGGTAVAAGEHLLLLYAAGNRDSGRFGDPDRLECGRDNAMSHLAFGHGEHFCLGAALARAEARVALEVLLERFEEIRFAPSVEAATLDYEPSYVLHGLKMLPLALTPRPEMQRLTDDFVRAAEACLDPALLDLCRARIETLLGACVATPAPADAPPLTQCEQACVDYAEKFVLDVHSITDADRWDPLESTCRHASLSIL